MREIKFKAKAIRVKGREYRTNYKNGDWVYGLLTKNYDEQFGFPAEMRNVDGVSGIEVGYKTVCQYTGLKDRNGKEIWEGDRVKHNMPIDNLIDVVVYSGGAFILKGKGSLSTGVLEGHYGGCEVIGNINDMEADNEKNKD